MLPGEDEARLTFLAVRRWFGWSSGRLLCLDIGGGSLELATGVDEEPDAALSVPLGAGRLTRDRLSQDDPPRKKDLAALREHVRAVLADAVPVLLAAGAPDRGRRHQQDVPLAGPAGRRRAVQRGAAGAPARCRWPGWTAPSSCSPGMRASDRARLPGVSPGRAAQLLAGAVVAQESLRAFGLSSVEVCPWALREGLILRRLDWLAGA